MNIYRKKICINFLKENCDTFIKDIHDYMIKKNWTWWDSPVPPTEERIKETFFRLLDSIAKTESIQVMSGGFTIRINDDTNTIECCFDSSSISLISYGNNDRILSYIDALHQMYPVLDKKILMEVYEKYV